MKLLIGSCLVFIIMLAAFAWMEIVKEKGVAGTREAQIRLRFRVIELIGMLVLIAAMIAALIYDLENG